MHASRSWNSLWIVSVGICTSSPCTHGSRQVGRRRGKGGGGGSWGFRHDGMRAAGRGVGPFLGRAVAGVGEEKGAASAEVEASADEVGEAAREVIVPNVGVHLGNIECFPGDGVAIGSVVEEVE